MNPREENEPSWDLVAYEREPDWKDVLIECVGVVDYELLAELKPNEQQKWMEWYEHDLRRRIRLGIPETKRWQHEARKNWVLKKSA